MSTDASAAAVAPGAEPASGRSSWAEVAAVVTLLTVVLTVVMTAFAWPVTRSSLHDIPLGVAGPGPAVAQVEQRLAEARPGAFEIRRYADEAAARQAIQEREVYGAVLLAGPVPTVLTASAAGPAVAQALTQLAQGIGAETAGPRPQVQDVVPAPADDPRGAGLAAGALPLVIGGILAAAVLTARVTGFARRFAGAVAFAVTGGLALTALLQLWLGSLDGSYWQNAAVVALALLATSLVLLGLESLLGAVGLGLGAATMILLGNPLSGLAAAPEMLPGSWGAVGQLLPPGAAGTLLRTVAFFPDAPIGRPLTVLLCWLALGLALAAVALARERRAQHRTQPAGPVIPSPVHS